MEAVFLRCRNEKTPHGSAAFFVAHIAITLPRCLSGPLSPQQQPDHLHQPQIILIVATRKEGITGALPVTIEKRPRYTIVQRHVFKNRLDNYQSGMQACVQALDQLLGAALLVSDIAHAETSPQVGRTEGGAER